MNRFRLVAGRDAIPSTQGPALGGNTFVHEQVAVPAVEWAQLADPALAHTLAEAAGRLLVGLRAEQARWADPAMLRDAADRLSHNLLVTALSAARPDDAVLSEEGIDDGDRLAAERVWILDPLDGTREFAEEGRTDWAVHVALWRRGALATGAVALPACGRVLDSEHPTIRRPRLSPRLRIAVSRTRPPHLVSSLATDLAAEIVPMGSAGAKIAAVVLGAVDAYVHAGGQYEWDSAAPVAVARAAGLHASRVDGSPLRYNAADPRLPDLMVCRPELAGDLLDAIRRADAAA
jgi:3'(2'), 5'-bisphosphate nucleotidase